MLCICVKLRPEACPESQRALKQQLQHAAGWERRPFGTSLLVL